MDNTVPEKIRSKYEAVIGLEVHAQLRTKTKIFCACSTRFGDAPNSNTCPICLGLPGTLPVLNKRVIEMATRASVALNCVVNKHSRFARKNYFYPDLPKGYQISQYERPLATEGEIKINGDDKGIRITRLHVEEDAAKNVHEGFMDSATKAYIDFNRCGAPLAEIVSEPDMRSAEEAYAYLTVLRDILLFAGVSDCDMEKGSLRCDANVSVRLRNAGQFGTKVEIKNLNSFRFVQKAIEYEISRQISEIENGNRISQETRLWNEQGSYTVSMRSKEKAHDYRYFPEPDLLPVHVSSTWIEEIRRAMPELRAPKRVRFVTSLGITPYDAEVLTTSPALADYFEAVIGAGTSAKIAANWIQTELLRRLNDSHKEIEDSPVAPASLAELLKLVESGQISGSIGKKVFATMFESGRNAPEIVATEGLAQISDTSAIEATAREVIEKNPENLAKFRSGNEGVLKFFVGQVMRATKGQANPQIVNQMVEVLAKLRGPVGDVVRSPVYDLLSRELNSTRHWAEDILGHRDLSTFSKYSRTLDLLRETHQRLNLALSDDSPHSSDPLWSLTELMEVVKFPRTLGSVDRLTLAGPLRKAFDTASLQDPLSARDATKGWMFELMIASLLSSAGFKTTLSGRSDYDFLVKRDDFTFRIECKRIRSSMNFDDQLLTASKRLESNLANDSKTAGLIALDLTRLMHIAHAKSSLAVDGKTAKRDLRRNLERVLASNLDGLKRANGSRVIGVLLYVRTLVFLPQYVPAAARLAAFWPLTHQNHYEFEAQEFFTETVLNSIEQERTEDAGR